MAKAKKGKKELTPEERLEQALVPEEEWPYELPEGWKWVRLGGVSEIIMGQSPKGTDTTDDPSFMPLIGGASDMGENFPIVNRYTKHPTKTTYEGDIILCIRATLGRPIFADGEYCLGRGVAAIRSSLFSKRFLKYIFLCFEQYLYNHATGSTFLQITGKELNNMPVPWIPIKKQEIVADRIENLFSKLDKAKEQAQEVVDSYENRKAAVQLKAITGKLTSDWRKRNGCSLDDWGRCQLKDVGTLCNGIMKGKKYSGPTVKMPYLRVANVQDGYLDLSVIKEIEVSKQDIERYTLQYNDVLFTEGGDYDKLGRGTVWKNEIEGCAHQNHVFAVRTDPDKLVPEYLSYLTGSQYGKKYFVSCSKQTTNLASINSTQLKNFPVILPSIKEQQEIVTVLKRIFLKMEKEKEMTNSVLTAIADTKKSILTKAFRGELL